MARIIAIANAKGGVAKTTSVLSLGYALSRLQQKVLLIDLDFQSNLSVSLDMNPGKVRNTSYDLFVNDIDVLGSITKSHISGLDIIPSSTHLDKVEHEVEEFNENWLYLQNNLHNEDVDNSYDFILMDCSPFMGNVTRMALVAADWLIIPVVPEYLSLYGLRTTMVTFREIRQEVNPAIKCKILLTMVDMRNRVHRELSDDIYSYFKDCVFKNYIPVDSKLREGLGSGLPFDYFIKGSRSALQYERLAREII